ncbi:MAG: glycosyltransferase family 9 protein [Aquificae bacterium]|nr:glycosyltransferase family 9 protein [Aquificota bacterium]
MRKALIVRFSSLGDVVLSSVLFEPLLRAGFRPLLFTFYPYGEVFHYDERVEVYQTSRKDYLRDARELPETQLRIDLHKNLRSLLLRLTLGGRWRTYSKDYLRRRLAVYFPTFRKPYSVTEAYLGAIGDLLGEKTDPKPYIEVPPGRAEAFKRSFGDYVVLAPGARYCKKKYPYFRELAEIFLREGLQVVFVGDERDRKETEGFPGENLCGELPLREIPALIKGSLLFVGNDSGLLHCARAVRTKAVQIYGGTHPTFGFSLYPEEGEVVLRGLSCQPCDLHGKGSCRRGDYGCLDIPPEEVFRKAKKLLQSV